ncbi:MAG: class I SAM-dependent methyltransferase [Pseudomonadota bacterium]
MSDDERQDLAMPTMDDALKTHAAYPQWQYALPLPNARMMLHVGAETIENFFVVADAWAQVLSRFIPPESHVLDIGCGCGRTARVLVNNTNVQRYTGFDVVKPYIAWCNHFFGQLYGSRFQFHHLDVRTERYNPDGPLSCATARFPVSDQSIRFAFAASLFTHLLPADASAYFSELHRVLEPDGQALVSIHDQPGPDHDFSGNEHRADYSLERFQALMREAGLVLTEDLGDLCGQRALRIHKPA